MISTTAWSVTILRWVLRFYILTQLRILTNLITYLNAKILDNHQWICKSMLLIFLWKCNFPNQHMSVLKHVNLNLRKKVCHVLVVFLSNTAESDMCNVLAEFINNKRFVPGLYIVKYNSLPITLYIEMDPPGKIHHHN